MTGSDDNRGSNGSLAGLSLPIGRLGDRVVAAWRREAVACCKRQAPILYGANLHERHVSVVGKFRRRGRGPSCWRTLVPTDFLSPDGLSRDKVSFDTFNHLSGILTEALVT